MDDILDELLENTDKEEKRSYSENRSFDHRGFVLENNVTLDELNALEPRFFPEFVKFVIDKDTNRVAVAMEVHASAETFFGKNHGNLFGGNIFMDGTIVYESTLNIQENLKRWNETHRGSILHKKEPFTGNPRIITDEYLQNIINATLYSWVDLKGEGTA